MQLGITIIVSFLLLSMRQNFFMDIATALVFTHYFFYFIHERINLIDDFIFKVYSKLTGNSYVEKEQVDEVN